MSEQAPEKPGPVLPDSVEEVQGIFSSSTAMEDAIATLTLAGFDRADLSLPATNPPANQATPEMGAAAPPTDVDMRQARNMGTGMASTIGAMAAAGATIATGGAAGVAIAAAAAVGVGSGLAANAVGTAVKNAQTDTLDEAAREGKLVLAVHTRTADKRAEAERIMRASGASVVAGVERTNGGIDSSAWTG